MFERTEATKTGGVLSSKLDDLVEFAECTFNDVEAVNGGVINAEYTNYVILNASTSTGARAAIHGGTLNGRRYL